MQPCLFAPVYSSHVCCVGVCVRVFLCSYGRPELDRDLMSLQARLGPVTLIARQVFARRGELCWSPFVGSVTLARNTCASKDVCCVCTFAPLINGLSDSHIFIYILCR